MTKIISLLISWVALVSAQVSSPSDATTPPNLPAPLPVTPSSSSAGEPPPTVSTGITPTATGNPGQGAICECGYTYCSEVLMAMKVPWNEAQLKAAYCSTPDAICDKGSPSSDIMDALFLCLCDTIDQKVGDTLHLVCGCDTCLNIGPDYRGRCKSPCFSGTCPGAEDGGGERGEYGWY